MVETCDDGGGIAATSSAMLFARSAKDGSSCSRRTILDMPIDGQNLQSAMMGIGRWRSQVIAEDVQPGGADVHQLPRYARSEVERLVRRVGLVRERQRVVVGEVDGPP
jgi:hypothetical protein